MKIFRIASVPATDCVKIKIRFFYFLKKNPNFAEKISEIIKPE
jgi:hypothetical protein